MTKQRFWRPKLSDTYVDALIKRLIKKYQVANESELYTELLIEADKKT